MQEFIQEFGLLLDMLTGARTKTPPNLLLLFQWGVLFVLLGRILTGWVRLERLADSPNAPTGKAAAARLQTEMRAWWRRGLIAVGLICLVYVFWLVMLESVMSAEAAYIGGMWAVSLWLLNSNIHRMDRITDIPTRQIWTVHLRNMSMSLVVFVIYCMFVQNLSARFISVLRQAYYAAGG